MSQSSAIITGAGRGIGRATAVELSKRGYRLALISRTAEQLSETQKLCADAETFPIDVGNADAVAATVDQIFSRFGRIDAAIHCAGVVFNRSAEELSADEWRETIDTNLSAVVHLARNLWPIWKRQGGGVMVNVSSQAARDPFPGIGAYGAAKAGVNLLGTALAREGAAHGIRVHTVAPSATETAMFRSLLTEEQFSKDKTLDPAEVARVIVDCVCGNLSITSGEVVYVHR
jgi:NAD(P)-dependent dehydrogenase (short-subunit alcohol dehydrogenase family)